MKDVVSSLEIYKNGLLYCGMGGDIMTKIDFDNINDAIVYDIFQVEGNEGEALNDIYLELFELIGRDAML